MSNLAYEVSSGTPSCFGMHQVFGTVIVWYAEYNYSTSSCFGTNKLFRYDVSAVRLTISVRLFISVRC